MNWCFLDYWIVGSRKIKMFNRSPRLLFWVLTKDQVLTIRLSQIVVIYAYKHWVTWFNASVSSAVTCSKLSWASCDLKPVNLWSHSFSSILYFSFLNFNFSWCYFLRFFSFRQHFSCSVCQTRFLTFLFSICFGGLWRPPYLMGSMEHEWQLSCN